VLAKKNNHAEVYQPAQDLPVEAVRRLERYLDAVRSTLLFAKGVLLVEGDAEQIMIPAMLCAAFGVSPDELGFSVISMSSAFFEHLAIMFADDRVQRPCAIVTDLDSALIELPENPEDDTKDEAHARASAKSGESRFESLQGLTGGNPWLRAFFAEHTFEVAFLQAGNAFEVTHTLDEIYENVSSKQSSTNLLESDNAEVAGNEILRLANKLGKGWFAILLSEKLDSRTYIPDYILRAVAFACCPSINEGALKRIGEFRVEAQGPDGVLAKALPSLETIETLTPAEFLTLYREAAPTDDLSLFCQYVDEYRTA